MFTQNFLHELVGLRPLHGSVLWLCGPSDLIELINLIKLRVGCLKSCMLRGQFFPPRKLHRRNQGRKVYFPCSAHWSSVRRFPAVLPVLLDTNMCCCICCTCQRKLGVRLTLVLPPSRMMLASASAAVALVARGLDGGSPSGSLGFCHLCPQQVVVSWRRLPPQVRWAFVPGALRLLFCPRACPPAPTAIVFR